MRRTNFMAGSVGGTAEDRKKANTIANVIAGLAIVGFITTMLVVTKTFQTPAYDLADEYDNNDIHLTSTTTNPEKLVSFYTLNGEDKTMIDILEWTENSMDELDTFLTSLIDAFDDDDVASMSLDQLNIAVTDNGLQNDDYEAEITAGFTKEQLIKLHETIKRQS